jgi:hypothetical protein
MGHRTAADFRQAAGRENRSTDRSMEEIMVHTIELQNSIVTIAAIDQADPLFLHVIGMTSRRPASRMK